MLRTLSCDGGGIGGIFTTTLIERLDATYNGTFVKSLDAIAGTSTGSIIAAGLAFGIDPKEISNLYIELAKEVFKKKRGYRYIPRDLQLLLGTPYNNKKLYGVLFDIFGDTRLGDLKKKIFIPTLAGDRRLGNKRFADAYFFNNIAKNGRDKNIRLVDACVASSSAPFYFKPWQGQYVDGGLVLNNPSVAFVTEMMDTGIKPNEMALLSLGTGKIAPFIDSEANSWNIHRYLKLIFDMITYSNIRVSDKLASKMMDANYFRFAPSLSKDYSIDDPKDMGWIRDEALKLDIKEAEQFILGFYKLYEFRKGAEAFTKIRKDRDENELT